MPREEVRLDVENTICACCGGALHVIGESVSEMLDWVPAELRVIRTTRPKFACRTCEEVAQAPAPERLIAGGLATPALLAQVLVSKYCDHTPLYRQAQIFARHGIDLPRSKLAGWVGGACWWLETLHERLARNVFASDHLFADDTPVPVLDPGRGRTKTGRLWVYAHEQRAWGGPEPPAAVYLYAPDRKAERPASHLERFKGVLHVDGYAGFEPLEERGDVVLAACWSHTRRKFYDVAQATNAPIAVEALRRIGELYAAEADAHGQSPAQRLAVRRSRSKPIVEALRAWLDTQLPLLSGRSTLAEAIRYALARWQGLIRFLHDGRIELDTNPVERAIRPIALGRKNHLFAGSDGGGRRWVVLCSRIETCMCGWPPRCKGFDGDFDAGSAACMCPAYKSRPQPLALMRSADRVLSKLARSRRSHVLLVVPISSIDRRVITSISADAPQQPASPRKRAMFLYRSIDLATRQHVPMRFSPSC